MYKRSLVCLCVFFVVSIFIINSAYAISLSFESSTINVSDGDHNFFNIVFNSSDFGLLTGYNLLIQYNPGIIEINNDDITVKLEYYFESDSYILAKKNSSVSVDNVSGTIDISWASDPASFPNEDVIPSDQLFTLAKLGFTGKNAGTSDLVFSSIELFDDPLLIDSPIIDLDRNNSEDMITINNIADNGKIVVSASQSIPEPATFLLLGTLLFGFVVFKRKETE